MAKISVSIEAIKELRKKTGAGVMDAKKALEESAGNEKKAVEWLKKRGIEKAAKKADREASEGLIVSYIHLGKVGVMLELGCETDFVARTEDFAKLAHELAMQVASMDPKSVEKLLKQEYIREPGKTIEQLIGEAVGKIGENIQVKRFIRWELGEEVS